MSESRRRPAAVFSKRINGNTPRRCEQRRNVHGPRDVNAGRAFLVVLRSSWHGPCRRTIVFCSVFFFVVTDVFRETIPVDDTAAVLSTPDRGVFSITSKGGGLDFFSPRFA